MAPSRFAEFSLRGFFKASLASRLPHAPEAALLLTAAVVGVANSLVKSKDRLY